MMFDCYRLAELKQKFFSNVVNKVNVKQEMIFFLFFFCCSAHFPYYSRQRARIFSFQVDVVRACCMA